MTGSFQSYKYRHDDIEPTLSQDRDKGGLGLCLIDHLACYFLSGYLDIPIKKHTKNYVFNTFKFFFPLCLIHSTDIYLRFITVFSSMIIYFHDLESRMIKIIIATFASKNNKKVNHLFIFLTSNCP